MTTKIVKHWDTHQADYEFRDDEDVRSEAQATHSHRYHNHLLFLHNLERHLFKGLYAVDAYPAMLKYVTYLHEKEDYAMGYSDTTTMTCFNIMVGDKSNIKACRCTFGGRFHHVLYQRGRYP